MIETTTSAANRIRFAPFALSLTALSAGVAILLFFISMPISQTLYREYGIALEWSWLAIPIGSMTGLVLGIAHRKKPWLSILGILLACLLIWLAIPIEVPDPSANLFAQFGYALGQAILTMFLIAFSATTLVCGLLSVVVAAFIVRKENLIDRDRELLKD